jgi:hypothetical protein
MAKIGGNLNNQFSFFSCLPFSHNFRIRLVRYERGHKKGKWKKNEFDFTDPKNIYWKITNLSAFLSYF